MLKRIYIDNFKGLVNFELKLDAINLFLGANGSGKSTVFEALRKIQAWIRGKAINTLFNAANCTRWQSSPLQRFELEIEDNGGLYKYELAIEHPAEAFYDPEVRSERLWFNGKPLLNFEQGEVQLYGDDDSATARYSMTLIRSVLPSLLERKDNTRLLWFKKRLERFIIVQINPLAMGEVSSQEETRLTHSMENFVSWYRYLSQDQGKSFELTNALREILDGFVYFKFAEAGGQHRTLTLHFASPSGKTLEYRFDELSEGQRTLIALYALIYCTQSEDYTLCIDEPENFVALREIQPWLVQLYDLCCAGKTQALLISHHPELINYLAASDGYWFDHQNNAPVRVKRISPDDVARGWLQ